MPPPPVKAYAGIGSRNISAIEQVIIYEVASKLSSIEHDYVCYSGNATGSDIAFQTGSGGRCVVFLPWAGFNLPFYNPTHRSLAVFAAGMSKKGLASVGRYHPHPGSLNAQGKMFMARNYHQVVGITTEVQVWPEVKFVVCCADVVNDAVQGGTGQACRIAMDRNIPIINLRYPGWREKLEIILAKVRQENFNGDASR